MIFFQNQAAVKINIYILPHEAHHAADFTGNIYTYVTSCHVIEYFYCFIATLASVKAQKNSVTANNALCMK